MTDSHEIAKAAPVQIERQYQNVPIHPLVAMLEKMEGPVDVSIMREMMQLQKEWEANEAKKAYTSAMTLLKAELPTYIEHDKDVDYTSDRGRTHYTHASLAKIKEETTPLLSKYGFSSSSPFTVDEKTGKVVVTCRITHRDGHSEETTASAPPDTKGGKNPAQAVASTATLLRRYLYAAMLDIATKDMLDDDNAPNVSDRIDMKKNLEVLGKLGGVGITKEKAEQFVGCPIAEWTEANIADLRGLYKDEKAARETAETGHQHEADAQ